MNDYYGVDKDKGVTYSDKGSSDAAAKWLDDEIKKLKEKQQKEHGSKDGHK